MTPEQTAIQFNKVLDTISFHVQNESLRKQLIDFLSQPHIKSRLLTAPAASGHHQAEPGGLLDHTLDVLHLGINMLEFLIKELSLSDPKQRFEDLVVSIVLHDISKVGDPLGRNCYVPNMIKAGKKDGTLVQSEKKPYVKDKSAFQLGRAINGFWNTFKSGAFAPTTVSYAAFDTAPNMLAAVGDFMDRNIDAVREGELSLLLVNSISPGLYHLLNDTVKFAVRYHDGAYCGNRYALAGKETPVQFVLHTADMISSRKNRWLKPAEVDESE